MVEYFQVFKKKNHDKAAFAFAKHVIEQYASFDDDKKLFHTEAEACAGDAIHAYTFATEILAHSGLHHDAYQLAKDSWFTQIPMKDWDEDHMLLWCTYGKWILHLTNLTLQNDNDQGHNAAKIHFTQSRKILRRLYKLFFELNDDCRKIQGLYFYKKFEALTNCNLIIEIMSLDVALARKFDMLQKQMIEDVQTAMVIFETYIQQSFGEFS